MSLFTYFIIGGTVILATVKLFWKYSTGWCKSNVCLVGRTAIITGANSGIGYETALEFAKRGAKVILACRDDNRGREAQEKIVNATGNEMIFFKKLDLKSLKSVRNLAADINKNEERLDILINNAGVGSLRGDSEDGLHLVMQVNYFGHFLLTNLLLDLLKKNPNSRIVNVSSITAKCLRKLDLENLHKSNSSNTITDGGVYAKSKLCQILFTIELANRLRGTGVTSYSVHPGVILTNIFRNVPTVLRIVTESAIKLLCKDSIEGAQSTVYCALEKGIENLSGEHFHDCHLVERYKAAEDPELPKKLWAKSERLVQLKTEETIVIQK